MRLAPQIFVLLAVTACTQTPAEIVLRGGETFSGKQRQASATTSKPTPRPYVSAAPGPSTVHSYVKPSDQVATNVATPAPAYNKPVDQGTASNAAVGSVGVSDLPPPPKAEKQSAVEQPKGGEVTLKPARFTEAAPSVVEKPSTVAQSFIWPVSGKVVARFGPKGGGHVNDGILISAPSGEPVYAAAQGEVVFADANFKNYGNTVLVKHPGGKTTTYAHMSNISVSRYDHVKQGDIVGFVGASGGVKTPQLYFAVRDGKDFVDPQRFLPSNVALAQ